MTQYEKLDKILEDEATLALVQGVEDADEVYRILTEKGLDVSREAFDDLLISLGRAVSEKMSEDELNLDQLDNVSGGSGILVTIGGVTIKLTAAAAAAFGVGFAVGVGVGIAALAVLGYCAYKKSK